MRISHYDVIGLKICNNLNASVQRSSKLMMQISTGQRINFAADDPAGFAISEKMRAQIRGLAQSSRNVQDSISLMQVAEGGLNETHGMLQRLRELLVASANDTNTNLDRKSTQMEIDQLLKGIDSIAKDTNFNGISLLDGSLD